jgi:hypothetical protein
MGKARLFLTKIEDSSEGPKPQEPAKRHRRSDEDLTTLRAATPSQRQSQRPTPTDNGARLPNLALLGSPC